MPAPTDMHSYVYRYLDGNGNLLYVGMTSNAAQRACTHWKQSDWVSWVEDVTYKRARNREEAYKLNPRYAVKRTQCLDLPGGYAEIIKEQDAKAPHKPCNRGLQTARRIVPLGDLDALGERAPCPGGMT